MLIVQIECQIPRMCLSKNCYFSFFKFRNNFDKLKRWLLLKYKLCFSLDSSCFCDNPINKFTEFHFLFFTPCVTFLAIKTEFTHILYLEVYFLQDVMLNQR